MKNCMLVLYWILYSSALKTTWSQGCDGFEGHIVLTGRPHRNLTYGMLSICDGEIWRAVCGDGWDMNDAQVLCRELGFPSDGGVSICDDSCFGQDSGLRGASNFRCAGSENKLQECDYEKLSRISWSLGGCSTYAGVICSTSPLTTMPPVPSAPVPDPLTSTRPAPTPSNPHTSTDTEKAKTGALEANKKASSNDCFIRGISLIVLGAVAGIFLLLLVGVAIGWACSHHKYKKAMKRKRGEIHENAYTYSHSTLSSVHYNALEAQDTPTSGAREDVYHLMEGQGGKSQIRKTRGRKENEAESALQRD